MLSLDFVKMNGAGNDFIMLDNRQGTLHLSPIQIAHWCDRHRGIGADGVLVLENNLDTKISPSLQMRYYNADGYEVEMCGNGARCFTRYVAQLLEIKTGTIAFQTQAGLIEGELLGDKVKILMSDPYDIKLYESLEILGHVHSLHRINTGVPHAVLLTDDLEHTPVLQQGRALRHHPHFAPAGTNVNFVQVLGPHSLSIRTFERGVEDETLACGTGVVAAALVHHLLSGVRSPISVLVRGGDTLVVEFASEKTPPKGIPSRISQVTLKGPADFIFTGTIVLTI